MARAAGGVGGGMYTGNHESYRNVLDGFPRCPGCGNEPEVELDKVWFAECHFCGVSVAGDSYYKCKAKWKRHVEKYFQGVDDFSERWD